MRIFGIAVFLFLLSLPLAFCQAGVQNTPSNSNQAVMAASDSLRILQPGVGEKISNSSVEVRYELVNRGADAAASPTYRLQLDGRDPVETLDTSYDFTGLAPGAHTVVLELVDANHTPIGGSRAVLHFTVLAPGAQPGSAAPAGPEKPHTTGSLAPPSIVKANLPLPGNDRNQLPSAGGELPLLSMVGFGVLVGGVISAMRGRKQ